LAWAKEAAGDAVAADEGSDDVVPAAPAESTAKPAVKAKGKGAKPEARMFRSRIYGPYAPSVRDGLNEMLIGTHLMAEGIQAAADPGASLDSVMAAIPSQLPTHGYITSGFGPRRSPFTRRVVHHNGVDFAVPKGAPVYATADGVVAFAGWHHQLGRLVTIDHGYGIMTRYGHNMKLVVHPGDKVHRGQIIARSGSSGRSTGPHVHYEVWINDHAIDPASFMFDVPAESLAQINKEPSFGLGLGIGGSETDPAVISLVHASVPSPEERLPFNLAIVGLFGVLALVLVGSQVPRGLD
jgi:murein DD-endopeptidase MepM/ murein hydrolase activator NlpD